MTGWQPNLRQANQTCQLANQTANQTDMATRTNKQTSNFNSQSSHERIEQSLNNQPTNLPARPLPDLLPAETKEPNSSHRPRKARKGGRGSWVVDRGQRTRTRTQINTSQDKEPQSRQVKKPARPPSTKPQRPPSERTTAQRSTLNTQRRPTHSEWAPAGRYCEPL